MAALILPHRYRSQARGPVEVDYSHPLAAGLVSAYNMTSAPLRTSADTTGRYNGRKSSAGKNPYTLHGYQNDGSTEAGLVYCSEGAVWEFGGTYATKAYNTQHPKSWAGAVTFVIRVLLRSNTADQCLIGHFNDGVTPDYLYGCGLYVTGGTLYAVGANNNSRVLSTTAPATDEWVTLACVTNTTDGKLAIDGQVVAAGTLAGALSSYVFAIGCAGHTAAGATSGAAFLDGLVGPALVFNRALSDAELRSISENPYQILRPANDRLWLDVIAGGGGGQTVSAGAGHLQSTGSTPSVQQTANQAVSAAVGALRLSGYAPAVNQTANQAITAVAGRLAVSGYAPAVSQSAGQTIAASSGRIALTGGLASVVQTAHQSIVAAPGRVTFAGYQAAVSQTGGLSVTPQSGRLSLSGNACSVVQTAHQTIAAVAGRAAFTGYTSVVSNGSAIVVSHQRVLIVPPQSRALAVAAESRTLTIAPQSRVLAIQGE